MSTRGLVVVCDDDAERVGAWADRIRQVAEAAAAFEIQPLAPHTFADAFRGLLERKASARTRQAPPNDQKISDALSLIDVADVLVIDYDLTPDAGRTPDPVDDPDTLEELIGKTGEEFAYLARCFSTAAAIVVVNQKVQRRVFDLTLQQFAESFANVNVTARYLESRALWTGSDGDFRPWSWPRLVDLPRVVRQTWGLASDLDLPVLKALGLNDDQHLYAFTQPQLDLFGDDPLSATFRDLATQSDYGLNAKDRGADVDDPALQRVAAAAVSRWLEWRVVPGQNVLVDAPHLAQRYPRLLRGDLADLSVWNDAADLSKGDVLDPELVARATIPASAWTSRAVWSLPKIMELGSSLLTRAPNGGSSLVFCEDTSRFVELDQATEIEIAVPTPYFQRFVEIVDDVDYTPRRRIRG